MREDDRALVQRSREGDMVAFEALMRRYQSRVCRTLYLLLPNMEDVEDVSQEVFIRVFRHLPGFRGDCEFSTWLHRITLNTLRNWTRARRPSLSLDLLPDDKRPQPCVDTLDAGLLASEQAIEVRKALAGLPPYYREALVLRHLHQLSYQEVAEIQQVPLGTVRSRIAKGRQMLFDRLSKAGIIEPSGRTISK